MNDSEHIKRIKGDWAFDNGKSKKMILGCLGTDNPANVVGETLHFLITALKAERIYFCDMSDCLDLTKDKPRIDKVVDKTVNVHAVGFDPASLIKDRTVSWPGSEIYSAKTDKGEEIYIGVLFEPLLGWQNNINKIGQYIKNLGITDVFTVGGVMSDVPHTRNMRILYSSLSGYMTSVLNTASEPASFLNLFTLALDKNDINTKSIWGTVPHYIAKIQSPKTVYALLSTIEKLFGLQLNLTDLIISIENYAKLTGKVLQNNAELSKYIEKIEQAYDNDDTGLYVDLNHRGFSSAGDPGDVSGDLFDGFDDLTGM